jgi:hypothetical protein
VTGPRPTGETPKSFITRQEIRARKLLATGYRHRRGKLSVVKVSAIERTEVLGKRGSAGAAAFCGDDLGAGVYRK